MNKEAIASWQQWWESGNIGLMFDPQISTHLLTPFYPLTCLFNHFTSFLQRITAVSHTCGDLPAWWFQVPFWQEKVTYYCSSILSVINPMGSSLGWTNRWRDIRAKCWVDYSPDKGKGAFHFTTWRMSPGSQLPSSHSARIKAQSLYYTKEWMLFQICEGPSREQIITTEYSFVVICLRGEGDFLVSQLSQVWKQQEKSGSVHSFCRTALEMS